MPYVLLFSPRIRHPRRRASTLWASLIARIDDRWPLTCPQCGARMSLIAFITEPITIRAILAHLGPRGGRRPH